MSDLIKMSDRTVRKPCKRCGTTELYWGKRDGNFILVAATPATRAVAKGAAFQVDDSIIHACSGNVPPRGDDKPEADEIKPETVHIPVVKPEPAPQAPSSDNAAEALAALRTLLGPQTVSRTDVESIVRDCISDVVFPTRTVVIRDDDSKPIDGLTHERLGDVLTTMLAGENVYLVGPAGTGKSHLAEQCAEALGIPFRGAISVNAMTADSDLMGFIVPGTGEYFRTPLREAYEHGGIFTVDEIDKGHPGVISVLNAVTSNGSAGFPDGLVKRHDDFRLVATANTFGTGPDRLYVGSTQLDAATLTRFTQIEIPIDGALERALCLSTGLDATRVASMLTYVNSLRGNVEKHRLPIVLSPRTTVGLSRLLAAGMTWEQAHAYRVRAGITDSDWNKVSNGVKAVV